MKRFLGIVTRSSTPSILQTTSSRMTCGEPVFQWSDELCGERESFSPKAYSDSRQIIFTEQAKRECEKRRAAYMFVRPPQDKLDPRIIKAVSPSNVKLFAPHRLPVLHYGLVFRRKDRDACLSRSSFDPSDPKYDRPYGILQNPDDLRDLALEMLLSSKSHIPLAVAKPFCEEKDAEDLRVVTLDDTKPGRLLHRSVFHGAWWHMHASRTLNMIRKELGLQGGQQAKWWWDKSCGEGYRFPLLPEYDPLRMIDGEIRRFTFNNPDLDPLAASAYPEIFSDCLSCQESLRQYHCLCDTHFVRNFN